MPLTGLKLFGTTVKNFSTNLGWGSERSSVRVSLVEDFTLGDLFVPPAIGTPVSISFYALQFAGILQSWKQRDDPSGSPIFDVIIEDPRSLLENVEIITGAYNGSVFGVPNLINAYGYLENNIGFGGSQVNESGMPWNLIKSAVSTIINSGVHGSYGGPITYKGISYAIDLSDIPAVPDYYRASGGTSVNLMRLLEEVCGDCGRDFFVDMIYGTRTIRIRTVSRRLQPAPGVLTAFVDAQKASGICKRSGFGFEARNEVTSSFIVGGEQTTIYETSDGVHQYFGDDPANGLPVVGSDEGYDMFASVNALEVYDILGTETYTVDMPELLLAKSGKDLWKSYIVTNRPDIAELIGDETIPAQFQNLPPQPQIAPDAINMAQNNVRAAASSIYQDTVTWKTQRVWNMVKKYADNYLGKQYLVEIPFVLTKVEAETNRIIYSHEPSSQGGYVLPEGVPPLSLDLIFQDQFSVNSDGRYDAFCSFEDTTNADLRLINKGDFAVGEAAIFVKAQLNQKIYWIDELTPAVLVTVANPIYELPNNGIGTDTTLQSLIFGGTPTQVVALLMRASAGSTTVPTVTLPVPPTSFAIPLKSNILTYGPWYASGAQGKVTYTNDPSLVPWNYGGLTVMNLTGFARVTDAITFQQFAETGDFELVGAPLINLGDLLEGTGPTLTNMDIGYSADGVTTTYRFRTFTNKFGTTGKTNIERIKKISLLHNNLRKEARQAFLRASPPTSIANEQIAFASTELVKQLGVGEAPHSPHLVLVGCSFPDAANAARRRVSCLTSSLSEVVGRWQGQNFTVGAETISHEEVSSMSLDGLLRPFKTRKCAPGSFDDYSSTYTVIGSPGSGLTNDDLDPFKTGNDIDLLLVDDPEYTTDAHNYLGSGLNANNQKPLSLRAPLVLTGWGYSTDDAWVPNADPTGLNSGIESGYLRQSHHWKTGPLEVLWDDERGVWTSITDCIGKTMSVCSGSGGSCELDLYYSYNTPISGRKKNRRVYNFTDTNIASGTRVSASFIPEARKWYVSNASFQSDNNTSAIARIYGIVGSSSTSGVVYSGYLQMQSGYDGTFINSGALTSFYAPYLDANKGAGIRQSGYYTVTKTQYGTWGIGHSLNPECGRGQPGIITAQIGGGTPDETSLQILGRGYKGFGNPIIIMSDDNVPGTGSGYFPYTNFAKIYQNQPAGGGGIINNSLALEYTPKLSYLGMYGRMKLELGSPEFGGGAGNVGLMLYGVDSSGNPTSSALLDLKYGINGSWGLGSYTAVPGCTFSGGLLIGGSMDLSSISGQLAAMSGTFRTDITNLQTDVSTLQTDVGDLQTDVGTLQTDVGTLQTDVSTIQGAFAGGSNGTFGSPTSITVVDGLITAIS